MAKKKPSRKKPTAAPVERRVDLNSVSVSLSDLREDALNARRHGERNLAAIRAALLEFGQVEPLVVMAETMRVIGGNGRLAVMRELGWKECSVVFFHGNEADARALAIALNRTGELAEWNPEMLQKTLDEIGAEGFDVSKLAFSDEELASIVDSALTLEAPALPAATKKPSRERERQAATDVGPPKDETVEVAQRWEVIVKCPTKASRSQLMKRLELEGFDCRLIIA